MRAENEQPMRLFLVHPPLHDKREPGARTARIAVPQARRLAFTRCISES